MIRNRGYTVDELASHFGTDRRTIYRYIKNLRDDLQCPVEPRDGVYSVDSSYFMPTLNLTETELVALHLACLTLQNRATLPDEARSAMEKLRASAQVRPRRNLAAIEEAIEVVPGPEAPSAEHLKTALDAYYKEQILEIEYHSREREEPVRRRVEPWGFFSFQNTWYMVGHDHLSGEQRTFRLDRVRAARLTGERYSKPGGFHIGSAIFHRFDLGEGEPIRVRLKVTPELARHLQETPGHQSQTVTGQEVEYRVKSPLRMAQWLLGLGPVEVLEPPELRAEVARLARETAARHA